LECIESLRKRKTGSLFRGRGNKRLSSKDKSGCGRPERRKRTTFCRKNHERGMEKHRGLCDK